MTMTAYDQIELFGLTETGTDELPIPNDLELQGRAVGDAFDCLIGTIQNTGLASEVEPMAHAFATLFQRRATVIEEAADRLRDKIAALIRAQDGSEVAEVELETAQRQFEATQEKADALRLMAEAAAEAYERETGDAYVPVTGSRTTWRAMAVPSSQERASPASMRTASGRGRTRTVARVITPKRPSLPVIHWRRSGPVAEAGRAGTCRRPAGATRSSPATMSLMRP